MNLILASSSSYRQALLRRLQLPFTCESPDIDESPRAGETPVDLVRRLAREKAERIASRHTQAHVIGSDQVASVDGLALGKPGTAENALAQLSSCSGKTVVFETGLCLISPGGQTQVTSVPTHVQFRQLESDLLSRYVELDQPLDCAGSFKCESLGIVLFESLESKDPTALEGLPLIALSEMLRIAGIEPLAM